MSDSYERMKAQKDAISATDELRAQLRWERDNADNTINGLNNQIDTLRAELVHIKAERDREASAFVDFVLRHTWPERAKAHGHDTVHSLIQHHPFAQAYGPDNARADGDNNG